MKTMLCAVSLVASLGFARAQVLDCGPSPAAYQAAMTYMAPVIYQASVVYQGPVAYYGPVYYNSTPASYGVSCEPVSTVVVIGSGRAYSYSNRPTLPSWGSWGSTVTYIGSRYSKSSFRHGYGARSFRGNSSSHGRPDVKGRAPGRRR